MGASLPDPDKLFNSELEGKQWRAIDIHKDDEINEGSLKTLIKAVVDYNTVKPKTGSKPPEHESQRRNRQNSILYLETPVRNGQYSDVKPSEK